jgi:plastocyanin
LYIRIMRTRLAPSTPSTARPRLRAAFAGLALTSTALLVGCGGGSGTSTPPPADAGLVVHAQEGIRLDASSYTAKAGDVVVAYVNDSSLPHNLHFIDANNAELPQFLEVTQHGQTATKTVTLQAGTYTILCKIAGHTNMHATLTVS